MVLLIGEGLMGFGSRAVGWALVAMLLGCQSQTGSHTDGDGGAELTRGALTTDLPTGWRWESYGGVELGVPDVWAYGTTGTPWCLHRPRATPARPYVGRPGAVAAIACAARGVGGGGGGTEDSASADSTDPATLLDPGGTFVWFDSAVGQTSRKQTTGDRDTLTVGGVHLVVQAPERLRGQILSTVHRTATDHNGCRATHPIGQDPGWRPKAGLPVGQLTAISGVSACRYAGPLESSLRLSGPTAVQAVAAVVAAPVGGGPNTPATCATQVAYGDEAIVLMITSSRGESDVVLRYSGCDHHGLDDGTTVRTLTRAAMTPFTAGPNAATSVSADLAAIVAH
jgi:hypothetical protein